ncbi:hypothetical protein [Roseobacter sp. MED193]|uniref:hypothetical protein n=1 Tax=Roseobacter sp. MED193 TaxID=314262 RepID=UPI00031AA88C|nr:hypothetical protein [Roseobacter sp. MED193]
MTTAFTVVVYILAPLMLYANLSHVWRLATDFAALVTPGIYERKGRKAPKKVFAFTDKAPSYQKAFMFYPKMNAAAGRRFPRHFYRALAKAFATRHR